MKKPALQSQSAAEGSLLRVILLAILVGLNLRPSLAAIGPLIDRIQVDIAVTYTSISLLTALPVLMMGLGCFVAIPIARRLGYNRLVALSLVMIGAADLARGFSNNLASLLLTAVVAGLGIAFVQAALPVLIKYRTQLAMARVMGWYIAAIMAGSALSSVLAPRIAQLTDSWQHGLAVWGLIAVLALITWLGSPHTFPDPVTKTPARKPASLYRRPRVWLLSLFFGLGTAGYTCVIAWLPAYYLNFGWSESAAGMLIGFVTAIEVVAGLLLPQLARRSQDRRPAILLALTIATTGFVLLWLYPLSYPYLIAGLVGTGLGGLFPLGMIVAMDHHSDPARAGALTGIVQGVGYFIATLSPLAAGFVRDMLGSFALAWAGLAFLFVLKMGITLRFNPQRYQQAIDG